MKMCWQQRAKQREQTIGTPSFRRLLPDTARAAWAL